MLHLSVKLSFFDMELSGGVIVSPGFVQKQLEVTSVLRCSTSARGATSGKIFFAKAVMRCPNLHLLIVLLSPLRTYTHATMKTVHYQHLMLGWGESAVCARAYCHVS